MVGIVSTSLAGCVPATYYSCSQSWLAFHFLLDNWNPRLTEEDFFPHVCLWLPLLQSSSRSCDSHLPRQQTHPHQGPIPGIFGSWLELLVVGLLCSGHAVLALVWICKAPQRPEPGLLARTALIPCRVAAQHWDQHTSRHSLPIAEEASGRAVGSKGTSVSPWAPSSPKVLAGHVAQFISLHAWEEARSSCPSLQNRLLFCFSCYLVCRKSCRWFGSLFQSVLLKTQGLEKQQPPFVPTSLNRFFKG